jgi:hypothetical protein
MARAVRNQVHGGDLLPRWSWVNWLWPWCCLPAPGWLVKSLYRLLNVNPGFDQHNLLSMGVGLSESHFPKVPDQFAGHADFA